MQNALPSLDQLAADNPGFYEEGVDEKEAARILRSTPFTLQTWRSRPSQAPAGGPPFVRTGRRIIYIRRDLYEWLARHRVQAS